MTRIAVVGTGYVGLVTGACLADRGHEVTCIDVDEAKVGSINSGRAPIFEEGLDALLERNVGRRLRATTDLARAVAESDVVFIAVGTPLGKDGIDLGAIETCASQIGEALRGGSRYQVVVVKSTVVPGTTERVVGPLLERASGRRAGRDFGLGVNPEFLTEGQAVRDFLEPDRIVVGGLDERSRDAIAAVYDGFAGVPLLRTDCGTAEMIKYASNALLATMISFANEIARLCSAVGGIDVTQVQRGVHHSHYLTSRLPDGGRVLAGIASFLEAGCGFGGSCLPKDVAALVAHGGRFGVDMRLLQSVLDVNRGQPDVVLELVRRHHPDLAGRRVTVLGLAFKPDTDDVRESPAFPIIERLSAAGARVVGYDPVAMPAARTRMPRLACAASLEEAVAEAEIIVLVTRWEEFRRVPELIRGRSPAPLFVDGRRMLDPEAFARYEGIGR